MTEENYISVTGLQEWRGNTKNGAQWEIHRGDVIEVLKSFPPNKYNCVITSPPYYWQRDYKVNGQYGLEKSIADYVSNIVRAMEEVRRVLAKDGVLFLNLGDTYYSAKGQPKGDDKKNGARRFGLRAVDTSGLGVPRKTTIGMPWRVALAMIEQKWILRSPIIWQREHNPPEPTAHDRPWRTYEMIFMFSKNPRYNFFRENLGDEEDVWVISDRPTQAKGVHHAAFPERLVEKCLKIACPPGGNVLDPFAGSGTVVRVASRLGFSSVGIDLSAKFCDHMVKELRSM